MRILFRKLLNYIVLKVIFEIFFFKKKIIIYYIIFFLIGNKIFYPLKRSFQEIKDPFRPVELSERAKSNLGAPSKLSAKPRLSHGINLPNQLQSGDTFSVQQRKTKRIRNFKRERSSVNDLIGKDLFNII